MSDILRESWKKYLRQLELHPLRTQAITAGVLMGSNDLVVQKISGVKNLQFKRPILLMLYGLVYAGPFGHFLHKWIDSIFKGKKGNKSTIKKVVVEQFITSPWGTFCFMLYYGLVVEGRAWSQVKSKIRKDFASVQLSSWKFWPMVGLINYKYIPSDFRVLFVSLVGYCWGIFLNLRARSSITPAN